jgi:hypothetical protein
MLSNTSSDFDLTIRQQPDRARVAGGKEKGKSHLSLSHSDSLGSDSRGSGRTSSLLVGGVRGAVRGRGGRSGEQGDPQSLTGLTERKPIDPPPVVQLRVREEGTYLAQ